MIKGQGPPPPGSCLRKLQSGTFRTK